MTNHRLTNTPNGLRTDMCTACARLRDQLYYAAYRRTRKCIMCMRRRCVFRSYNGISSRMHCFECARVHNREWYAAFVERTRCRVCGERTLNGSYHAGRRGDKCLECAETHDAEWFAEYAAANGLRE